MRKLKLNVSVFRVAEMIYPFIGTFKLTCSNSMTLHLVIGQVYAAKWNSIVSLSLFSFERRKLSGEKKALWRRVAKVKWRLDGTRVIISSKLAFSFWVTIALKNKMICDCLLQKKLHLKRFFICFYLQYSNKNSFYNLSLYTELLICF